MSRQKNIYVKKAFSLIELLIVILIISLVYMIGLSGVSFSKAKPKALSPLTLKETLLQSKNFSGKATLLCVNKCNVCYLRKNPSSAFEEYIFPIDLSHTESYTLDKDDSLNRLEYGRYDDKKICLIMDFYTNGSSTQIILKRKNNVYFLPAFFGKPQKFSSLEKAKDYWLEPSRSISNTGDFY